MLRFKTKGIYNELGKYYDPTSISLNELIDFCESKGFNYCVINYSEEGLYLNSNGSICRLNSESDIVEGTGEFAQYMENELELYDGLKEHLDKITNMEYDIVYENSVCIKAPEF